MLAVLAVSPESRATDTAARGDGRVELAARRVDAYLTELTTRGGSRPYMEVPPFLADVLRGRVRWSIESAGVSRALERARAVRGPEEPAGPGNQMTPAPGGPPLPPAGMPQQGGQGR
jgi:hypothetical protein